MIPEFNELGYLPPGIHPATIDEIDARFGRSSESRSELMQSLRWLLDLVRRDDVLRVVVNGSFVTNKDDPEDVDCVLLIGPTFGTHGIAMREWQLPLPFIHVELADQAIFDEYEQTVFGIDLLLRPKGMVEVIL